MARKGCKLWTGFKDRDGYGSITRGGKSHRVHRYFYELTNGKIPKGLVIDHLCRVRACINTAHMEVVTIKENNRRGRMSKLNMEKVIEIRKLYAEKKMKQLELARLYKVGPDEISRIINMRRWVQ